MISQHQIGHLTENQMKIICGRYDEDVFSKFDKDESGKYFNERLEYEIERRKGYCASRGKNKSGKTKEQIPKHLQREPFKPFEPTVSEGTHTDFAKKLFSAEGEGELISIRDYCKKEITSAIVKQFNAFCATQSKVHPTFIEWKKHLANWFSKQKSNTNTNGKSENKSNKKYGRIDEADAIEYLNRRKNKGDAQSDNGCEDTTAEITNG